MLQDNLDELLATLAEVAELKGQHQLAEIVRGSEASIEESDQNFGYSTYEVRFAVSPQLFTRIESSLDAIEKDLLGQLQNITRSAYESVGSVTIVPAARLSGRVVTPRQQPKFWTPGYFRLFISHVSTQRAAVAALSTMLESYGISSFVAHQDIEPTKPWVEEILLALNTMDGLLAYLTPGFKESNWTDQECGVATGRGAVVVAVRAGVDPYGFIGRYQGVTAEPAPTLPERIARVLAQHPQTRDKMAEGVVTAFCSSKVYIEARSRVANLEMVKDALTAPLRQQLREALEQNDQITGAWGVVNRVRRKILEEPEVGGTDGTEVPF